MIDENRRRGRLRTGGDRTEVPLEDIDEQVAALPDAETQFERAWVQSVVDAALGEVRSEMQADGRALAWTLFEAYDLRDPASPKVTYSELGAPHRLSEADVRGMLALVRGRLRERVVEQVRRSVSDPEELCVELGHLGFL